MKIHEYQAKDLLTPYGLPFQQRVMVSSLNELGSVSQVLGGMPWVVKAQVLAGGRGKAGGVKLVNSLEELRQHAERLLGKSLITIQTGPEGEVVHKLLIEKASEFHQELYVAIVVDRRAGTPVFLASKEGGVDIEVLARERPEAIVRRAIDPWKGLLAFQARALAFDLGLKGDVASQAAKIFLGLARAFFALDASLAEINPLVITTSQQVVCIDAKLTFDDNAVFRHAEIKSLVVPGAQDEKEERAKKFGLSYVSLDGSIGCLVNGAGLAMATMDIIKLHGGDPANFLDVGGGATAEAVAEAFTLIMSDARVKAILVNIFGGIMKCDTIANGIVEAVKKTSLKVPLVVRLEGTNVEEGKRILKASGLNILAAADLNEAAKRVVAASKEAVAV